MNYMERSLKRYERIKIALDNSSTGYFDINIDTGEVYFSSGWKKLIGYNADELPDSLEALHKNIEPTGFKQYMEMINSVKAEVSEEFSFEIKMKHKNEGWIDIFVRARALKDEDDGTLVIAGTHTDITKLKDTEATLRLKAVELQTVIEKTERQRTANLVILNDFNKTTRELLESHTQLRELSHHLQNSREEQSAYIAREIHDDLGQELTALEMMLSLLEDAISVDNARSENIISLKDEMREQLDSVVQKTRKLTHNLRPTILDSQQLDEAIVYLVNQFNNKYGVKVFQEIITTGINLGEEKNLAVFRIFQEALNNIAKHSGADTIHIKLGKSGNMLNFEIRDNGRGFDTENKSGKTFGMMNMQERAVFCGGELKINSETEKGTEIILKIPDNES